MKICTQCSESKDDEQFAWKNRSKGTRQAQCHPCRQRLAKESYQRRQPFVVAQVMKRGEINRQWFRDYKATLECKLCKESAPCCLDFHHLDPSAKEGVISEMVNQVGRPTFMAEIAKCVCLCSNCHRKLHAGLISLDIK